MTANELKIAGLLLAAGGSSRLGRPKQLVEFEGETLIRRASTALSESGCDPVVVVLGAEVDRSSVELGKLGVESIINEEWGSGLSTSIRVGIESLLVTEPLIDAVLITLVDQPQVTGGHLKRFVEKFSKTSAPIIAAEYDGVLGVPALFDRSYFPALAQLAGDKGARDLIRTEAHLATIPLPDARVDIDTIADLENLHEN